MGTKFYFQTFDDDRWQLFHPPEGVTFDNLAERMMFVDDYVADHQVPMRLLNHMGRIAYCKEIEVEPELEPEVEPKQQRNFVNIFAYAFVFLFWSSFVLVIGYGLGRAHQLRSLEYEVRHGIQSPLVDDVRQIMGLGK